MRMLDSMVIPITKNHRKTLKTTDRGVALNSPISKLFELVILLNNGAALATSDAQFGFKKNSSTTQCTFVLLETIDYFNCAAREFCLLHVVGC